MVRPGPENFTMIQSLQIIAKGIGGQTPHDRSSSTHDDSSSSHMMLKSDIASAIPATGTIYQPSDCYPEKSFALPFSSAPTCGRCATFLVRVVEAGEKLIIVGDHQSVKMDSHLSANPRHAMPFSWVAPSPPPYRFNTRRSHALRRLPGRRASRSCSCWARASIRVRRRSLTSRGVCLSSAHTS